MKLYHVSQVFHVRIPCSSEGEIVKCRIRIKFLAFYYLYNTRLVATLLKVPSLNDQEHQGDL